MLYWYSSSKDNDHAGIQHCKGTGCGNHTEEHQLAVVLTLQEVI